MECEKENHINFLDITIAKKENRLSYTVYRKPTTTDIIIPNDSCHPSQQKMAAIRFLTKRRDSYQLDSSDKLIENNIINQILSNNLYKTLPPPITASTIPKSPLPLHLPSAQSGHDSRTVAKKRDTSPSYSATPRRI
jgi:hypothetical protein